MLSPLLRLSPVLVPLFACGCAVAPVFEGPLPVRNQHPAQLMVLHLDPISTQALQPGQVQVRADSTYSSMFLGGAGSGNTFQMDGEILRTGIKTGVGLGHGLQLRAELPFAHTTSGVLDAFLIRFHQFRRRAGPGPQRRRARPLDGARDPQRLHRVGAAGRQRPVDPRHAVRAVVVAADAGGRSAVRVRSARRFRAADRQRRPRLRHR